MLNGLSQEQQWSPPLLTHMIEAGNNTQTTTPMLWEWHPLSLGRTKKIMKHNSSIENLTFRLRNSHQFFEAQLSKYLESLEISSGRKVHNISTDIHRVLGAQGRSLF